MLEAASFYGLARRDIEQARARSVAPVQARAGLELLKVSSREPRRDATLLVALQQSLPVPAQQTEDEREMTMNLERVYEPWERKVIANKQVLGCGDDAQLEAWVRAAVTTPSVKALLARR